MIVYVQLARTATDASSRVVYALLLPDEKGRWDEVRVAPSTNPAAGWGCYPAPWARNGSRVKWDSLHAPVLMPYLGVETVVQDEHLLRLLVRVLQGDFEELELSAVARATGNADYVSDGICVVAASAARGALAKRTPLPLTTPVLQVSYIAPKAEGAGGVFGSSEVCYLLRDDVRALLRLDAADSAHLWELLCAHSRYHHTDRHLATHVAHVYRVEEGYTLVNAHPAFREAVSMTGMINEPPAKVAPSMKLVQGYARFLDDSHELMRERGLKQPKDAAAAWRMHTLAPPGHPVNVDGLAHGHPLSERMTLFATTRKSYPLDEELTVDYGRSYRRDYDSHKHSTQRRNDVPTAPDVFDEETLARATWPDVPGWYHPELQPMARPAFARVGGPSKKTSRVVLCPDDKELVKRRRALVGLVDESAAEADEEAPQHRAESPTPKTSRVDGSPRTEHKKGKRAPMLGFKSKKRILEEVVPARAIGY